MLIMKINFIDKIFAILLFLLGSYIAITAISYGYAQGTSPASGFFPFWMGVLIAGLSIVNFVRSLIGKEHLEEELEIPGLIKSLKIGAALLVFVFTSDYLGMAIGCGLLVLVIGWIIRPEWDRVFASKIIATAILFPIAAYVMFGVYLNVPVPKGILGF